MKRRNFVGSLGAISAIAATTGLSSCSGSGLNEGEILHTVIFDLKHPVGSAEAVKFLKDGKNILTKIKGVKDFQVFRQNSTKNDYEYGFLCALNPRRITMLTTPIPTTSNLYRNAGTQKYPASRSPTSLPISKPADI